MSNNECYGCKFDTTIIETLNGILCKHPDYDTWDDSECVCIGRKLIAPNTAENPYEESGYAIVDQFQEFKNKW